MPILTGVDKKGGPYVRWGKTGAKYYYKKSDQESYNDALDKAHRQGIAIEANKAKQKRKKKGYLF